MDRDCGRLAATWGKNTADYSVISKTNPVRLISLMVVAKQFDARIISIPVLLIESVKNINSLWLGKQSSLRSGGLVQNVEGAPGVLQRKLYRTPSSNR
jgi:hypothetical protein